MLLEPYKSYFVLDMIKEVEVHESRIHWIIMNNSEVNNNHKNKVGKLKTIYPFDISTTSRGSIPAKVGFWVGLKKFSYVCTPTKLSNAISKPQFLGPKKGGFSTKIPGTWPFFCIWRVLVVFSGLKPAE